MMFHTHTVKRMLTLIFSFALLYTNAALAVTQADQITPNESSIMIDQAMVRVKIEGPETGEPIILLHGFTASLESWDAWAKGLSDKYRVIRYDLLGHGMTGPDPLKRYAPVERAVFLENLMASLNIETAHIAGNSLGGLIAWRFAERNPEKVKSLILISPGAYSINGVTDTPVAPPEPLALFLQYAPEAGVKVMLERQFGDPTKLSAERVSLYHTMMTQEGNGQAFIDHINQFTLPDPSVALKKIKTPTLILWGTNDITIPTEQARWLAGALPNSQLMMIEGAGHMAHEEEPAYTLNHAKNFLNRH